MSSTRPFKSQAGLFLAPVVVVLLVLSFMADRPTPPMVVALPEVMVPGKGLATLALEVEVEAAVGATRVLLFRPSSRSVARGRLPVKGTRLAPKVLLLLLPEADFLATPGRLTLGAGNLLPGRGMPDISDSLN